MFRVPQAEWILVPWVWEPEDIGPETVLDRVAKVLVLPERAEVQRSWGRDGRVGRVVPERVVDAPGVPVGIQSGTAVAGVVPVAESQHN